MIAAGLTPLVSAAQDATAAQDPAIRHALEGFSFRGIGPALMSGRISDIAIDPADRSVWYVATASSGIWKTENRGTTWTPIFDDYASYSIGSIALDPSRPGVVWAGTGENTSQRSVGWGDGVYRSVDGGVRWTRMGLKDSGNIGKVIVHPEKPEVIYAAALGSLWAPGGDRGLYRSVDGGESWEAVLAISEHTGVADVIMDPFDPEVLYASAYQRRRHVGVLVAGGPESGVWKSVDGGDTWRDVTKGLPDGDLGRIAIAASPIQPNVVYALAAATMGRSGFYRSHDGGENWVRMSDYIVVDPQYYGELYPDPHRMDRVYAADVHFHVTDDGGRTFRRVNSRFKHVDNHALVFDPEDPEYLLAGTDGGLYESFDRAESWRYVPNLPITQFYRVGLDESLPFYSVYGGTQDNSSVGGPSRTANRHGIRSSDWFVTHGGDGFQARVDPRDPNVVYTQSQYAGIVRYDRRSGEELDIQPQPGAGEPALRWHWDAPLILSPHDPGRIYFAAQKLFRSEDQGSGWTAVSGDLSRGLDRNQRRVMGRMWPPEAVWKNVFTSPLGTITALAESPLQEGLLYVGTDDGLIQTSEDGGAAWRASSGFSGVPEGTYVADVAASRHSADRVYAVFNNHKEGDFSTYVRRSDDRGESWQDVALGIPSGQPGWSLLEDHLDPELLFLGTEFGLFATLDGGRSWHPMKAGLPTIPVRDMEIQARENDLALATFGRGFYILDDYSPLRSLGEAVLEPAHLFPSKDAFSYIPARPLGGQRRGTLGDAFFTAPNPPFGAVFTYLLASGFSSRREARKKAEAEAIARGEDIAYPAYSELEAEEGERAPEVFLVISDESGDVVRRVPGPRSKGLHRVAWDLRYAAIAADASGEETSGALASPGIYRARLAVARDGAYEELSVSRSFEVRPLLDAAAGGSQELLAFQRDVDGLRGEALIADESRRAALRELDAMRRGVRAAAGVAAGPFESRIVGLEERLTELGKVLVRDASPLDRAQPGPPAILERLSRIARSRFTSSSPPTQTQRESYMIATELFDGVRAELRMLVSEAIPALGEELRQAGVSWAQRG